MYLFNFRHINPQPNPFVNHKFILFQLIHCNNQDSKLNQIYHQLMQSLYWISNNYFFSIFQ